MRHLITVLAFSALLISCKKNDNSGPQGPADLRDSVVLTGLTLPWEIFGDRTTISGLPKGVAV